MVSETRACNTSKPIECLVVVLNYAIGLRGRAIGYEPNIQQLFDDVLTRCNVIKISALVDLSVDKHALNWIEDDKIEVDCIGVVSRKDTRLQRLIRYVTAVSKITKTIRRHRCFYIFVPGHISFIFLLVGVLLRKRIGVYLRGDWDTVTPFLLRGVKGSLLSRTDFILTSLRGKLSEVKRYNSHCSEVIPMTSFPACSKPATKTEKKGNSIRLLFVGQILREKGVFDLAEAVRDLRLQSVDVQVIYVGGGPDLSLLRRFIRDAKLDKDVVFFGYVKDRTKLEVAYQEADVFVLPTYFPEGFPRVLYEAMMFGLPIITTSTGTIESVMLSGRDCLVVPPRDKEQLKRAILSMAINEQIRCRTARNGRKLFERMFCHDKNNFKSHGEQLSYWALRSGWQSRED